MSLPSVNVLVQVAIAGLLTGGVYALMVSGLTLIFGVMRVINIAHGAFLVLGAYLAYQLFASYGIDPLFSLVVSVPLFFAIGYGFQRYVLARVRREPALVASLATVFATGPALKAGAFVERETDFLQIFSRILDRLLAVGTNGADETLGEERFHD